LQNVSLFIPEEHFGGRLKGQGHPSGGGLDPHATGLSPYLKLFDWGHGTIICSVPPVRDRIGGQSLLQKCFKTP
jgi:hypothetical protein